MVVLSRAASSSACPPRPTPRNGLGRHADAPFAVRSGLTDEKLLFITDLGNCYPVPVSQIPEGQPRDRGIAPAACWRGWKRANTGSLTPAGD